MSEYEQTVFDEIDMLASAWIDDLLTDEESDHLQKLLCQSEAHRKHFFNFVHTDTMASELLSAQSTAVSSPQEALPKGLSLALSAALQNTLSGDDAPKNIADISAVAPEKISTSAPNTKKVIRLVTWAAAAVILFGVMVTQFNPAPDGVQQESSAGYLTFTPSSSADYTLTHLSQADVSDSNLKMIDGSRMHISQGSVELVFSSGVKSVVSAPADFTLNSVADLQLDQGRAWFHVPSNAIGFTVRTETLKVVDMGTKFGVRAQAVGGADQIHVFKGKVLAMGAGDDKEVLLKANQAQEVDASGGLRSIPCDESQFDLSLSDSPIPALHLDFDRLDGESFQIKGNHSDVATLKATLISPAGGARLVPGIKGSALSLDGNGSYISSNWPGISGNSPRTISFWLKLPQGEVQSEPAGIVGWGAPSTKSGKWEILVRQNSPSHSALAVSYGRKIFNIVTPIPQDQWQHVAVCYSGTPRAGGQYMPEVYINGKQSKVQAFKRPMTDPIDTKITHKLSKPLSIGVNINTNKPSDKPVYLKGVIDDLSIFDAYLNEDEIKRLARP